MSFADWREQVDAWEEKYGLDKQNPDGGFSPNLSTAVSKRPCEKCGRINRRLHRHHKGNDFYWAILYEDEFAERYIQFHPEDIVVLCNKCHNKIHQRYNRKILGMMLLDWQGRGLVPPIETCRIYRQQCIEECEKWLTPKKRKRKRSRKKSSSGQQKK